MKVNVDVEITPEDAAKAFAEWGSDEQVRFLNAVAVAYDGSAWNWVYQLQYIADHGNLTPEARRWMKLLRAYG